jgi:3-oxoacyl-[acyl-carrier protein] reductase
VVLQAALPTLRSTAQQVGTAKVIGVASITGEYAEAGLSAYAATKAALISLCDSLNVEESVHGISAAALSPGFVDTDMSDWVKGSIRSDEMIAPADIATLVLAITELSRYAVVPGLVVTRLGPSLRRA